MNTLAILPVDSKGTSNLKESTRGMNPAIKAGFHTCLTNILEWFVIWMVFLS